MPNAEDLINNFMNQKNKEILGEKIEVIEEHNDNFLDDPSKPKHTFTNEAQSNDDKALLAARRTLSAFLTIPILLGGLASLMYIVFTIGPSLLKFIRHLLIILLS